jgi:tetratricopeptide (TPR) repeat protein
MPNPIRPSIFISAASRDLASCRKRISDALLTLGCVPVEQTTFPPDYRTVRDMLRDKLKSCHAIIHLAGHAYGSEPTTRPPNEPRRSYTQLELELARELKIPAYTFICAENFPYDPHEPEPPELQSLQQAHRTALLSGDPLFTLIPDHHELDKRVRELQVQIEQLRTELRRARQRLWWGLAAASTLLALLGLGLWTTFRQTTRNTQQLAHVETELDQQRRYIQSVADAYTRLQSELKDLKLTPDQLWARALATVAEREKLDPAKLKSGINLFIAATRATPSASFLDRALADFAEKNFPSAADNAAKAADQAKTNRLAAEQLAAQAAAEAQSARSEERNARNLEGQALYAQQKLEQAVAAFDAALSVTPRGEAPKAWAELQVRLALAAADWANRSAGPDIASRRARAVAAYRAALEVHTRTDLPQQWAGTQNNLGAALSDQAAASPEQERARLLAESVAAYRGVLEVCTRTDLPQDWAMTQYNLANALRDQAAASPGPERARLLAEAVAAYRAALEVYTRADLPQYWAGTQNNLALALRDLADTMTGTEKTTLLRQAIDAMKARSEIYTREVDPKGFAAREKWIGKVEAMLKSSP